MPADDWVTQHQWTKFSVILAICLFVGDPSHAVFGGTIDSFSADQVEMSPDGKVMNTSKVYVTKDAMRLDGMPGGGSQGMPKMNISVLAFKKQNKQYFYNHDKKLVFESEFDEKMMGSGYQNLDNIESEKVLGKEKVSGYMCVKKDVVSNFTIMGMTTKVRMIVWESDAFEFPLRTQREDGHVFEMRNIDTAKPDKKHFRRLAGYKKVGNMMAAMGMDFGTMSRPERHGDKEETESASPQNMEDMMATMKQAMGENADPETMAQMQQIMSHAMNQAAETKQGDGVAAQLWKIVPQRAGDKIGHEAKFGNVIDVILGTNSSLEQVFSFYGNKLKAKGWADGGTYIQDGQGTMSMRKGDQMVMFAWADNPGMEGNFKLFYNVHYTGPDPGN